VIGRVIDDNQPKTAAFRKVMRRWQSAGPQLPSAQAQRCHEKRRQQQPNDAAHEPKRFDGTNGDVASAGLLSGPICPRAIGC